MKHCPECNRNYADTTLSFCLQDGAPLIFGPAEESETAILSSDLPNETATRTFEPDPTLQRSDPTTAGKRWLLVAGALGVVLVAALGIGGYLYYGRRSARQIDSIAVMPFSNESGNPDVEYLSDGMTDTLIRSLSELPNIKVKARTSVFRFKGKEIDAKAIGRELGVQAIVSGRVSQLDGRTSVSLEVVDTESEDVIFSTKYDKPQSELVTLQSDIARDVSGKLKRKLSGADEAKISKTYTADPAAYQLYLKGDFYWHKRGRDNLLQATDYFNRAIEKDPDYALAYAGLALNYAIYPHYNAASPADSYPRSKVAALRALELDESLAEPHATLGNYYCVWEWDYVKAEKEFRRAIELNPNYATGPHWFSAGTLAGLKRFDEAIAEATKAQDLDPLSPIIKVNLGDMYYYARRTNEAMEIYRSAQELDPTFYVSYQGIGNVFLEKGQYAEAIRAHRRAVELSNSDPYAKGLFAAALARAGQREEALDLIGQIKRQAANEFVRSDALVFPYIALGNKDEAFVWLEKAVDDHVLGAIALGVDPLFDDLRSDPRFKALLKRMNLPE